MRRHGAILAAAAVLAAVGVVTAARTQDRPAGVSPDQPAAPHAPDMGMMLINGLRQTPGCLGVDAGQMMSGKNTIVAWFENKAAAVRWYESDVHQSMMGGFIEDGVDAEYGRLPPLAHVKDEKTPIMVMASITFADRPHFPGVALPISQISIELFAPLPGGAHLGGRLAPKTFKVEHMRDFTPVTATITEEQ